MRSLFKNIRFWILCFTGALTASVALAYYLQDEPIGSYVKTYAFLAAGFLYLTLIISPLIELIAEIPFRAQLVKSRRALGVSAFFLGCFHAFLAFFFQLGGFAGLFFLSERYLVAIAAATIAAIILMILALTSFDAMVRRLGPKWKKVHRMVYLAAILILFHMLRIGSLFIDMKSRGARVTLLLVGTLVILEALRLDRIWRSQKSRVGIVTVLAASTVVFSLTTITAGQATGLSVHGSHLQQATQNQQPRGLPGLTGDSTKRYTVSFVQSPSEAQPGNPVTLIFTVFDAASGLPVDRFSKFYEQFMHVIIVDSKLTEFAHVHPEATSGKFILNYTFPSTGLYHVYLNFVPYQALEQQIGISIQVGGVTSEAPSAELSTDSARTRQVGAYTISVLGVNDLNASEVTLGRQQITYTLLKTDGFAVTTLQPYMGAFGHLTLINLSTFEFVHAHPELTVPPKATDLSGPVVTFLPLGLTGPIKSGVYRAFAEFNPDGSYLVAPFTITIK